MTREARACGARHQVRRRGAGAPRSRTRAVRGPRTDRASGRRRTCARTARTVNRVSRDLGIPRSKDDAGASTTAYSPRRVPPCARRRAARRAAAGLALTLPEARMIRPTLASRRTVSRRVKLVDRVRPRRSPRPPGSSRSASALPQAATPAHPEGPSRSTGPSPTGTPSSRTRSRRRATATAAPPTSSRTARSTRRTGTARRPAAAWERPPHVRVDVRRDLRLPVHRALRLDRERRRLLLRRRRGPRRARLDLTARQGDPRAVGRRDRHRGSRGRPVRSGRAPRRATRSSARGRAAAGTRPPATWTATSSPARRPRWAPAPAAAARAARTGCAPSSGSPGRCSAPRPDQPFNWHVLSSNNASIFKTLDNIGAPGGKLGSFIQRGVSLSPDRAGRGALAQHRELHPHARQRRQRRRLLQPVGLATRSARASRSGTARPASAWTWRATGCGTSWTRTGTPRAATSGRTSRSPPAARRS